MLTATSRVTEPVIVDTPSSISDKLLPENVIMISIDEKGKTFFNINNAEVRKHTLEKMGQQYKITFTPEELKRFGGMTSFGVPIVPVEGYTGVLLKEYINMEDSKRVTVRSSGIPHDSVHNQLRDWIQFGRIEAAKQAKTQKDKAELLGRPFKYEPLRFALKADGKTTYLN